MAVWTGAYYDPKDNHRILEPGCGIAIGNFMGSGASQRNANQFFAQPSSFTC
jgi:hypothetical protein